MANQTFSDWEVIIVDDGSTDDTPAIVRSLADEDGRIRHLRTDGHGLSSARNAGLRMAVGEFIQLLDSDDVLGPGKLAEQVAIFESNPALEIVYGPATYFRSAGDAPWTEPASWRRTPAFPVVSGRGSLVQQALLRSNIMVVEAPLVRRRVFNAVGGFDESLIRMEDWELWLRCALAGVMFGYADASGPDAMSYVRLHGANMSRNGIAMLRMELEIRERMQLQLQRQLQRSNGRRMADIHGRLGLADGMEGHLMAGMRACLTATLSGGKARWLPIGLLLPATRVPPVSWMARWMIQKRTERSGGSTRGPDDRNEASPGVRRNRGRWKKRSSQP